MAKLNIGSSSMRLDGFLNVDIRPVEGVDVVAHAGRLDQVADGSVEVIFAHTFIEHVFVGQQLAVLREWRRVLVQDGLIVVLGIPDFRVVAELYLNRRPGIVGERFDLFNVYRYTHGDPEQGGGPAAPATWANWDPGASPDAAPPGWLPQLHKGLYDAGYLAGLLTAAGFDGVTFNYAYPGEQPALNLGFVATPYGAPRTRIAAPVADLLRAVPGVERFSRMETVLAHDSGGSFENDGLLDRARRLAAAGP